MAKETEKLTEKEVLHPRNRHRSRYDFKQLIAVCPELKEFAFINKYSSETIDFSNPVAVKVLNKALLKEFYGITNWDIPPNYLCPPIPGRADYIHYIADLLSSCNDGIIPKGKLITCLDIGVGANCVYPLIGNYEYGWSFVGSDSSTIAIHSAKKILQSNDLKEIELRKQTISSAIFKGIIKPNEFFDISICNPPFHSSLAEAQEGTLRKLKNLNHRKVKTPVLNFGGQDSELWCKGGELKFVSTMIQESAHLPTTCFWFSSLVSKSENLLSIYFELEKAQVAETRTIEMKQGNKISRIIAWTYLSKTKQKEWQLRRWKKQ